MKLYISAALAALALIPATVAAQQLSQEVDVEHEVVPTHRDFSPLQQSPTLLLDPLKLTPPSYSNRLTGAPVTPSAVTYSPAAWGDTLPTSPWRGYLTGGYWPAYHLDASAGYRLLDTDRTRLSVWGQLNGANYSWKGIENRRTQLAAGATLRQAVGRRSFIDAALTYRFASFNAPCIYNSFTGPVEDRWNQYTNGVDLNAAWHSSARRVTYNVGLDYTYFGYRNPLPWRAWTLFTDSRALDPARQHIARLSGDARLPFTDTSSVGLDASVTFLHTANASYTSYSTAVHDWYLNRDASYNRALITATPRYILTINDKLRADLGVRFDFAVNSGTVMQVAPDVKVTWQPASMLRISGNVTGGRQLNTLESLFDINHLMAPSIAYKDSRVPLDATASILIGPRKAIYGELFGGWAKAKDWLMPQLQGGTSFFAAQDISGWHAGVRLGARYKELATLEARFETAGQGYDTGYYLWRDRAKYVAGAKLTVTPIKPLDVTVAYELRARRAIIDSHLMLLPVAAVDYTYIDLGNISDIDLSATYRLSDRLSLFLTLDNLLSRHQLNIGGVNMEGFTGLVGASWKF
ncbi:MAG: hypothetical protein NC187_05820 [Candidatus Amulumruptor caecigallinarius]|nr:hypothetical protein [Candidatus Amulumruptor caecigallinarius]MCM1396987.1 hypothetical protein [Candidatus Amulumruptor caecigallinarius]MCM1454655.1 hypothetical protein [bacterium]